MTGFSLVELMVALSVLAVLITLAVPSLTAVINNNRLAAQANEVVTSLQLARSEAVRLNQTVTVCRTTDGVTCAAAGPWERWITLAGAQLLRDVTAEPPVQITGDVAAISFRSDGMARNAAGGLADNAITVCVASTRPAQNRRVVALVRGSAVSTSAAGDGSGSCP